jgi:hypothetical protein
MDRLWRDGLVLRAGTKQNRRFRSPDPLRLRYFHGGVGVLRT